MRRARPEATPAASWRVRPSLSCCVPRGRSLCPFLADPQRGLGEGEAQVPVLPAGLFELPTPGSGLAGCLVRKDPK